jgi:hypothetical protein
MIGFGTHLTNNTDKKMLEFLFDDCRYSIDAARSLLRNLLQAKEQQCIALSLFI